jgi:hypothetical protein
MRWEMRLAEQLTKDESPETKPVVVRHSSSVEATYELD